MTAPTDSAAWFPPGLDPETAAAITAAWWATDPHLAAALAWEAYAATLAPSPSVASVNTGAQSVSYSPPGPVGEYGAALERARWHRSFLGSIDSAELINPDAGSSQAIFGWYADEPLTHWWADA